MNPASQVQGYALSAVMIAAGVLYAVFIFLPGQRTIEELSGNLAIKQDFCMAANSLDASLARADAELQEIQRFVQAWNKKSPQGENAGPIHGATTAAATEAGAETRQFEPHPAESLACVIRHPITLGVRGDFGQIHSLVNRLESMPAVVWIESLQIRRSGEAAGTLECELKLAFFAGCADKSN